MRSFFVPASKKFDYIHELDDLPPSPTQARFAATTLPHTRLQRTGNMSFMPPAPIAQSIVLPAHVRTSTTAKRLPPRTASDEALYLQRRGVELERQLQSLLDAQAEGLQAQSDGRPVESASATSQEDSRSSSRASRSRHRKRISLAAARRGLSQTIEELAACTAAEGELLDQDLSHHAKLLRRIDGWVNKRGGLKQAIGKIQEQNEDERVVELKSEKRQLETDIQDTELRLTQMRNRHRALNEEIAGIESSVQSKLSSYQSSLAILERDVAQFLRRPSPLPSNVVRHDGEHSSDDGSHIPFTSLPPKRRTLELAQDHFRSQLESLGEQRDRFKFEQEALQDGLVVWSDVLEEVTAFERLLREHMRSLSARRGSRSGDQDEALPALFTHMEQTLAQLESKYQLAETKNWTLLVCCIGAEIEAFKQGKEILAAALGKGGSPAPSNDEETSNTNSMRLNSPPAASVPTTEDDDDIYATPIAGSTATVRSLDPAFRSHLRTTSGGANSSALLNSSPLQPREREPVKEKGKAPAYDTEDEEPDPEMLISHLETDSE